MKILRIQEFNLSWTSLNKLLVRRRYAAMWELETANRNVLTIHNTQARLSKKSLSPQRLLLKISGEISSYITQFFKEFPSLKSLSLVLPFYSKITQKGICDLSQGLTKFSSLEYLDFCIYGVTDQTLAKLSQGLRMNISLKGIKFHFVGV